MSTNKKRFIIFLLVIIVAVVLIGLRIEKRSEMWDGIDKEGTRFGAGGNAYYIYWYKFPLTKWYARLPDK